MQQAEVLRVNIQRCEDAEQAFFLSYCQARTGTPSADAIYIR